MLLKNKIRRDLDDNSNICHTYPFKKKGKGNLVVSLSSVKLLHFIIETSGTRKIDIPPHGLNDSNGLRGEGHRCFRSCLLLGVNQVSTYNADCFLLRDLRNRLSSICQHFQVYKPIFTRL